MSVKFGFFNSVNGDRKYNAEDMTKYFDKIVSDGVFHDPADALQVAPSGGMVIQIKPGRGLIFCRWLENSAAYNITLEPSHVTLNRTDRIVMRLNLNESARNMELTVIRGTPSDAPNPDPPPLSSDPLITELALATVLISHGVTEITSADITDTRTWVRSLVASSGGTLKKYQSYQTLSAETSTITPGIAQFSSASVLQVYVGGILMTEGEEYTVTGTGATAVVNLTRSIRAGNSITCVVLTIE